MSALLAAALQGRQKNSEVIEVDSNIDSDSSSSQSGAARPTTLSKPTLSARIVKPVLQIPSNVIKNTPSQPNLSSTTLEQLREFDMVYKQVKERSSTNPDAMPSENSPEPPTQRISVTYLNQSPKLNCSPVVVVSTYSNIQSAASPALSVTSQGSSSPCVTPASTPPTKVTAKTSKGKSVKNATIYASKSSPIPKPQQKPQEDEQTTQRIFDILAEYAEQLRNSPDLNNKPAPRRRSNPPTNPSQNSKRKKSSSSKKANTSNTATSEVDLEDPRTIGSEDSSCGVVQLTVQDDDQTNTVNNVTEVSEAPSARQPIILTDSNSNQKRNLIIADSVGEALKIPNTAVLVPGNYIMPVSMVKGGQQIAVVSGGSKILATVPTRSGPNMLLFQSFLNQNRKSNIPTVKYSTIQPLTGITQQPLTGITLQPPNHSLGAVTVPVASKTLEDSSDQSSPELVLVDNDKKEQSGNEDSTIQPDSSSSAANSNIETLILEESSTFSDTSSEKNFAISATPVATPVIAQNDTKDVTTTKGN